ncbi:MAG TPA: LuxR C-terminal-related transcriptional regulator [Clostridia bacterium]|nr:LuxR C-terminal-related transcriptional regulator [Clostridia bacterium]
MEQLTLGARLKSDKKTRDAHTVTIAFVALYCWYSAFWDNINLENHASSLDMAFNDVLGLFQIACVAVVIFGFFFIKGKFLSSPRPLWIAAHILAFAFTQALMLTHSKASMISCAIGGGVCVGLVGYRLFYTMFFYISKPNPVRAVAVAYIFIRTYIYIYAIVPEERFPELFFAVQAVTLLFSLLLSLAFRGNDIEIRYLLRENDFRLQDTWPTLLYVAGFQICLSLYQGVIAPQMPSDPWLNAYQIIPSAVTFFCMLRFSRFFTIANTVRLFLVMIAGGFVSFLALGRDSRILVDTFIQPAYLFANTFYIWLIYSIFFTYGNRYLKLRLFLCLNAGVHYLSLILVKSGDMWLVSHPKAGIFALPFIFGLFLLVPAVDTFIRKINVQREYIESQKEREVLLPPEHPSILAIRDRFLRMFDLQGSITQRERDVLSYLIADHGEEMIAYYMALHQREVKAAIKSILSKCGVSTKAELMMHIGRRDVPVEWGANLDAVLAGYGLTNRELEVCKLLVDGKSLKQIAAQLQISFSTANSHYKAIYRKLDVSSRAELLRLFIPSA